MAATIKIKNSSTTGSVPSASNLVQGELAVNVTDLGLYTENASGTVVKLNAPSIDDKNTGATKYLTIDTSGNLGLGVTPSAWSSGIKAAQIGLGACVFGSTSSYNNTNVTANMFYNSGGSPIYQGSDFASFYQQVSGSHRWFNAPSGTAGSSITFTQAMTLDASGNLGVGTTSPQSPLHVYGTNGITIGVANSTWQTAAIRAIDEGAAYKGSLAFYTHPSSGSAGSPTERARIDSSGNLLVNNTTNDQWYTTTNAGITLQSGNFIAVARSGGSPLIANRLTNDGDVIEIKQAGTTEGTISVSGTTVSYNGGHLSRYAQTIGSKDESLKKGTVLSNLDEMNTYTNAEGNPVENEQLNKVKVSDVEGDANVAGVFVNWSHDEQHNVDEINMAMTGDMIIRIAQGTTVARGDLLMSAGDGTAKAQGDDIVRAKTIAKVTSIHVTCTYEDGSYCVPCVLMAC